MCGIAGALAFRGSDFRVTEEFVTRMRETVRHRGPDGARTWVSPDGAIGLGFRRLAIVDLADEAMQPMANEDGSVRLLFNGEVYNHLDIRRELEASGRHAFRTDHSDTETIVHAFEEWGIDCLDRLRGMFGLAIWDGRARELWLARDRMGIKPLFYSTAGGRLTFGSEVKTILADPAHPRRIDDPGGLPLPVVPDRAGATHVLRRREEASRGHVAPNLGKREHGAGVVGPVGPRRPAHGRRRRRACGASARRSCARRSSCAR